MRHLPGRLADLFGRGHQAGLRLAAAPAVVRYGFAVALFALALGARFALVGVLPPRGFPFLTFFPAVLLAAYFAGLGPGLLASALSVLAAWYHFIDPVGGFAGIGGPDVVALVFFSAILVIDCVALHVMNRALARLREADRHKDAFVATLAHELRNPLAPIRSAVRILQAGPAADARAQRAVAIIDRQSAQLTRLVDDLLDISRITLGRLELQPADVDLRAVVDNALEAVRPLLEQAGHALHLEQPATPVPARVDAARIAQCVANLLHNAAKFTPAPGRIELLLAQRPDGAALVRVRDNCRGIEPRMLGRVFEQFAQERRPGDGVENTGLGIGLALARTLVRLHGGELTGHSDGPGRGATFEITLPAR